MTAILVDGFDVYNGTGTGTGIQAKWTPGANGVVNTSLVSGRFGGQAVQFVAGLSNAFCNLRRSFTAGAALGVGIPVRFTTLPSADSTYAHVSLLSTSTYTLGLRVTSTGGLEVYRLTSGSAGTSLGTASAGTIVLNAWHSLELGTNIHDTTGSVVVKVDGATVINLSNVDTNNAVTTANTLQIGHSINNTGFGTVQFDDCYVIDSATTLGDRRVETIYPTADTAQKDFARSTGSNNYALVDEATANGDTDYVQGSTVGNTDRYTFGSLSSTPTNIEAAQFSAFAEKTDATARSIALQVKSGATTSDGSNFALTATYGKFERLLTTDPNTSAAWTASVINSIEAGPKVTV